MQLMFHKAWEWESCSLQLRSPTGRDCPRIEAAFPIDLGKANMMTSKVIDFQGRMTQHLAEPHAKQTT